MNTPHEYDRKTTHDYWEGVYTVEPRLKLPSALNIGTLNLQRLLKRDIHPGDQVLEIGCAPGKMLSWVAARLDAKVSGLDYAEAGVAFTHRLFDALNLHVDLRCEDVFKTSFANESFDVVYSNGVVEHFDDPSELIRKHVELLKPGGVALIVIPHYGGIYGRMQKACDPDNLAIHNLSIMSEDAFARYVPADLALHAEARAFGRCNPWLVSLDRKLPRRIAQFTMWGINFLALIQPFVVHSLAPALVLRIVRKQEAGHSA